MKYTNSEMTNPGSDLMGNGNILQGETEVTKINETSGETDYNNIGGDGK